MLRRRLGRVVDLFLDALNTLFELGNPLPQRTHDAGEAVPEEQKHNRADDQKFRVPGKTETKQ